MTTVVNVMGTLDRGGVETVALELCELIPPSEMRQVFVVTGDSEGRLAPRFRAAGAVVHRCQVRPKPLFPFRWWGYLRRVRPDVVVSHISVVSGLVLLVAALAGVRVRIARMSSEGDGRPDTLPRRAQRALLRGFLRVSATDVLGVTAASVAFAGATGRDPRYRVLPNGVDVARFARARELREPRTRGTSLVHIGRAAPEKNRGFLLRVLAEAKRLDSSVTLTAVGPGENTDLEAVDREVASDPSVRLIGEHDQVERILADADVLLLPSLREGLPTVVLEALAAGVPVLCSDLPGLCDLAMEVEGLTLLPLDEGPAVWARTALQLAGLPEAARDRIAESLAASRFTLTGAARAWRTVCAKRS
ncbi:glycosyltransferase [Amycolatopsis pigmentata]|uniref:Glycosyltransferase n=1 Tax=Amycolatopsis pigmentata TaxID=450801 RepID=A0ABW5FU29_9PSEU